MKMPRAEEQPLLCFVLGIITLPLWPLFLIITIFVAFVFGLAALGEVIIKNFWQDEWFRRLISPFYKEGES